MRDVVLERKSRWENVALGVPGATEMVEAPRCRAALFS